MISLWPRATWWIALLVSTLVGQLVLMALMETVRWKLQPPERRVWLVSTAMGLTERATITILFILTPKLLPAFIGGWTVAKLAAGWGRVEVNNTAVRASHMMALVGSVLSYAIAIAAGYWAHPESLGVIAQ